MCIEKNHQKTSLRRQCQMLSLARSNLYYTPKGESAENLQFMTIIDKQFLETPWYGSRQMARRSALSEQNWLRRAGRSLSVLP